MILSWLKRTFTPKPPREIVFVPYDEADPMLRAKAGWRLSPADDRNRQLGYVYLERDVVSAGVRRS